MTARFELRSAKPELMDDMALGGDERKEALRQLRTLNRIFGASRPVLYGVKRLWKLAGKPSRLTVLDVGSGSGDINRALLNWARKHGVELSVILADVTEEARIEAEQLFGNVRRVTFVRQDLFGVPACRADIVTASQFAHHFDPERLPSAIERLMDLSRIGTVVSDIHRHWIPWAAVWVVARLISGNRFIRHDGPLSVAKGFRKSDFQDIARQLGITNMKISWKPLFRFAVIIPKKRGDNVGR